MATYRRHPRKVAGWASLEARKVYAVLNDAQAARLGFLRVVDESGDDYLFPRGHFADVRLSTEVTAALTAAR